MKLTILSPAVELNWVRALAAVCEELRARTGNPPLRPVEMNRADAPFFVAVRHGNWEPPSKQQHLVYEISSWQE